jgi:hypothetical protein
MFMFTSILLVALLVTISKSSEDVIFFQIYFPGRKDCVVRARNIFNIYDISSAPCDNSSTITRLDKWWYSEPSGISNKFVIKSATSQQRLAHFTSSFGFLRVTITYDDDPTSYYWSQRTNTLVSNNTNCDPQYGSCFFLATTIDNTEYYINNCTEFSIDRIVRTTTYNTYKLQPSITGSSTEEEIETQRLQFIEASCPPGLQSILFAFISILNYRSFTGSKYTRTGDLRTGHLCESCVTAGFYCPGKQDRGTICPNGTYSEDSSKPCVGC